MYDLIVIGGGPAGTSAAITAARSGASVLLLERGRFPRHKVCGEFVSAESLDLLGKLLDPVYENLREDAISIAEARIFLDDHILCAKISPPAASIARFDLDAAMWTSAECAGIAARQQTTVLKIEGHGPFHLKTCAGEFEACAVINASGRWSNLTATVSAKPSEKWVGWKGHFLTSTFDTSVDLYFLEGGYCGVQPVYLFQENRGHGRVNACAMVRAEAASTLADVLALHPTLQERSQDWQVASETVTTSPLFFRKPVVERDGILQAGDAVAFVDPFIGDGISLALRSGALAAQCLLPFLQGETSLADCLRQYRKHYQRQLASVFRASSRIRQMLALPRGVRRPVVSLLERNPSLTQFLVSQTR